MRYVALLSILIIPQYSFAQRVAPTREDANTGLLIFGFMVLMVTLASLIVYFRQRLKK